jgi:hypothetical protein
MINCTLAKEMMRMGPPVTQEQKNIQYRHSPGSHDVLIEKDFDKFYQMWKRQMFFFRPIPPVPGQPQQPQQPQQFEFVGFLGVKRDGNKNNEFFFVPKYPGPRPNSSNNTKLVTTPFNKDGANQMIKILMEAFPEVCFPWGPFGIPTICTSTEFQDLREKKQMFDANGKYIPVSSLYVKQKKRIQRQKQKISGGSTTTTTTPVPVAVPVKKQQQKSVAILPTKPVQKTTTPVAVQVKKQQKLPVAVQVKKQQKLPVAVPVAGVVGLATTTTTTQQKTRKQAVVVPPPSPVVAKSTGLSSLFGMKKTTSPPPPPPVKAVKV